MRPEALFPWFAGIETLKGVGPRIRTHLERLVGPHVKDLLFHLPAGIIDRGYRPKVAAAEPGRIVTIKLQVLEHRPPPHRGRGPYRVFCGDDTGQLALVFFHARADYLKKQLPEGETRMVSGKLDSFQGQLQITHPDYILQETEADAMPALEPLYGLTAGVSVKTLHKAIEDGLDKVGDLPEWLDQSLMKREGWPGFLDALKGAHRPHDVADITPGAPARARLAYDELLANQLALALVRDTSRRKRGRALQFEGALVEKLRQKLPYTLTGDQEKALAEIAADMESPHAMLRLLQGDVGSGKTAVAMLAAAAAVEGGVQVALLAPTEILAQQHMETIAPLAESVGMRTALLTGRVKGRAREAILMALMAGDIDLLVGTHAIFQQTVEFKDLGLAIIDEQHRFGVAQRASLAAKGKFGVDVLGMTATPIPRTLTLTVYGDMDVSRIVEKPPGRLPVDTRVIPLARTDQVVEGLHRALAKGAQVYWVCPLVAESEQSDLAAASARADSLKAVFGDQVGLVHGQLRGEEKDDVMSRFVSGELRILVATTVIEVGVNVPSATVMVIEHAERFGLAQLHQLRGRVGRGADQSTCLLLRADHIGEVAQQRLATMRDSEDGFYIAEEDLRLRGGGEVLGTRQSGLPSFAFVDYSVHTGLIAQARDDARLIVERDRTLSSERGAALRHLLYLFERDAGVRLMGSG